MSSMLFLALVIVAVSGLIAYIGDLVGRKMGRKRLSLFGLRPRYTAIVISVGSGMLIALLTLAATIAINKGVRDAFFRLEQVRNELKSNKHELYQLDQELGKARSDAQRTATQLRKQSDKLEVTTNRLQQANGRRDQALRQLLGAQAGLHAVEKRLATNQQQLAEKQQQLASIGADLTRAEQEYRAVNGKLSTSQAQLQRAQQTLLASGQALLKVRDDIQVLQGQKQALDDQVKVLQEFVRSSFSPLAFASGQELISALVPTRGDRNTREALLGQCIAAAERIVRQRSQELPSNAPALIFVGGTAQHSVRISREEAITALAQRVTAFTSSEDVIVRLASINNAAVNGPVLIAVDLVDITPNVPVYAKNDEVASLQLTITPQTTTADILTALQDDLLRSRLPAALRENQMLMLTRRFDPAHAGTTPEVSLSTLSWADLLAVAEQACAQRGAIRIVARSRSAVTRFGPLTLSLHVVPVR